MACLSSTSILFKKWIDSWIASKDVSFFRRGIHLLLERWKKVMVSEMDNILNDQFVIIFHNKAVFLLKNPLKLMHIPNIIRIENFLGFGES